MEFEVVQMTPDLARSFLPKNIQNRPISQNRVVSFAAQMRQGLWQMNGQTISFSVSGRLTDGQHRLLAVIASGCTVPMAIIRGVPDEAFHTIDTGQSRKASDIIALAGFRNSTNVSAVASQWWRMMWAALADQTRRINVPPPMVLEVVNRWPSIEHWTAQHSSASSQIKIPASTMVPALIYLSEVAGRPELAKALWDGLTTGAYLERKSPILMLRNKIYDLRTSGSIVRTDWIWIYMIRTIDALEAGTTFDKFPTSAPYQIRVPANLKEHMTKLPREKTLVDLKPPEALPGTIRNQHDALRFAGITDTKAFEAVIPPTGREEDEAAREKMGLPTRAGLHKAAMADHSDAATLREA